MKQNSKQEQTREHTEQTIDKTATHQVVPDYPQHTLPSHLVSARQLAHARLHTRKLARRSATVIFHEWSVELLANPQMHCTFTVLRKSKFVMDFQSWCEMAERKNKPLKLDCAVLCANNTKKPTLNVIVCIFRCFWLRYHASALRITWRLCKSESVRHFRRQQRFCHCPVRNKGCPCIRITGNRRVSERSTVRDFHMIQRVQSRFPDLHQ